MNSPVQSSRSGTPIKDLELSIRATNALQRYRSDLTVEDLDRMSDLELLRIPHLGRRCLKEIREVVAHTRKDPLSLSQSVMLWAERHQTLVLALMKGEAVIVPVAVIEERKP